MFEHIKKLLIDEWKQAHKMWSVQLNAAGLGLLAAAETVKEAVAFVPPSLVHLLPHIQHLAMGLFVFGLVARLFKQKKA